MRGEAGATTVPKTKGQIDSKTGTSRNRWLLIALCVGSVIGVCFGTKNGVGLSPDSVAYISSGSNFANGRGLRTFEGYWMTIFPPGLPFIVAIGLKLGLDPDWTIRIVNCFAMVATILLASALMRRHVATYWLRFGGVCFVAVGVTLREITDMAWSEPLFVVISLAFIIILEDLCSQDRSSGLLLLAAVVTVWFAVLFRYTGIALIPIAIIVLLIRSPQIGRRQSINRASIFATGALIAPVAWMVLFNLPRIGRLVDERSPSTVGVITNAKRTLVTVGQWLLGPSTFPAVSRTNFALASLGGAVLIFLLVVGVLSWRTKSATPQREGQTPISPLIVFAAGYTLSMVAYCSLYQIDMLGPRLLAPVFVPAVILVVIAIDRCWSLPSITDGIRVLTAVILMAVLAFQTVLSIAKANEDSKGVGYASPPWRSSELAHQVSLLPEDAAVFTNEAPGVWARTHRQAVFASPQSRVLDSFRRISSCEPSFLAWFAGSKRVSFMRPDELVKYIGLEPVVTAADGVLYRLMPASKATDCKPWPTRFLTDPP